MQEKRQTLIADFAIQGRLAYLSHQETLTMLQRALLRAEVPVAFSRGFNPRPRLSIPLPRSVGTQSGTERLCAVLLTENPIRAADVSSRFTKQLPADCVLLDVQCVEGKRSFYPSGVRYVFTLLENLDSDRQHYFADCQADIEAGRPIEVQRYRAKKKTQQPFDISPFVEQLCFSENQVEIFCRVSQEGSVRIDELMQWLHLEADQLKEPVKRTEIQWEQNSQEHN
ncbi:MAG: DUF2344 domain-containing protein [Phycisphaerae bacterium]|nr:DUF2344 domain-containing protein [Phycisphaerae bacterium]